jgi:hypothetical protein
MLNIYCNKEYKISFDGTNFITLPANTAINMNDVSFDICKLYFQTTTETGYVQIIYGK